MPTFISLIRRYENDLDKYLKCECKDEIDMKLNEVKTRAENLKNQDITIDWEIAEDIVEFETQSSIPTSKDFYEIKTLKHNNGINYSLERHVVPIDQNYWWLHSSAHTDCGEFRVTYHGDPVIGEPVLLKQ